MSASNREQIQAEIQRLRKEDQNFLSNGAFGGWTKEEEAVQDERLERLRALNQQLEALNDEQES